LFFTLPTTFLIAAYVGLGTASEKLCVSRLVPTPTTDEVIVGAMAEMLVATIREVQVFSCYGRLMRLH